MKEKHLKEALKEVGKLIKKNLKTEARADKLKASGNLDRSFRYRVVANELQMFGEEYANALSKGISTGNSGKKAEFEQMQSNLIKWAKRKGMQPLMRTKKGRFRKNSPHAWKQLGYVLARSIRKKGLIERFGYKGSGFIERVKEQTRGQIKSIIKEAYKKDILASLDEIKRI